MYASWKAAPESVHVSWRTYFRNMEDRTLPASRAFQPPPGLISSRHSFITPGLSDTQSTEVIKHAKVQQLVREYQSHGHYRAKINPLGLQSGTREDLGDLDPLSYGLSEADMDQVFTLGPDLLPNFITEQRKTMTLREIIAVSKAAYCGTYSAEFNHIADGRKRTWLRQRLEIPNPVAFMTDEKRRILDSLLRATALERFLAAKFPNDKRFGLDGSESLAPGVDALLERSADVHGVESFVVGSCHRGRLTMLSSVWGKATEDLFAEFAGRVRSDLRGMVGDVKYHHGHDGERATTGGRKISISLLANPSHLEAVDPVAAGKARATQELQGGPQKAMCVALHGDAAIAGQGVVYETLGLAGVPAYDVGGTVRIVVNNQVGFTAEVQDSRATPYASDVAKYIEAPIFHVNGNDVEAVVFVCQQAADWRAEFGTDCVVDIVSYRRFGHNELDQPSFTQPLMYQAIKEQKPVLEQYIDQLVEEGTFTREEIDGQKAWFQERLEAMFEASKSVTSERTEFPPAWKSLPTPEEVSSRVISSQPTGVEKDVLGPIADRITTIPEGFNPHSNLRRILSSRRDAIANDVIDWTTAEAMAFGTLSLEGHAIRLTGQDVQRGTFSQRHAVFHDQVTGEKYTPLSEIREGQAQITIENSPLSEFGVLGFEYGVSLADPTGLVMWEAQFGDFANNTQVIIDNFIAAGESKWLDRSGVVLSLPHGYDGQGAEHSSARPERFLMLCGEEGRKWPENLERGPQDANMSVVYPTTPANYFHMLRRQQKREFRKPLVIFFSKSLLRHPLTRSTMAELSGTTAFQPVLEDPVYTASESQAASVSRIILCSGQVYAALHKHRETHGLDNCAITRIEEMHPFPWAEVKASLDKYPNATSIVWAQEEHYNGGAWHYVRDRLETVLEKTENHRGRKVLYAGRGPSASTAAGLKSAHAAEEAQLLEEAFNVER
ncbi:thiamine diphosphate-binding protein [Plectosphaerella plurivora]|uniref:2-oxoglutarate dehydrogenase, mitochondrial n=1 Tax=Plectosphaerella plurivora TaxID=936078 RepID=A0A9P8VBM9_9PEZI|nr:thiamine diphosphate-binding protein [Plectosphaerella plurivora]